MTTSGSDRPSGDRAQDRYAESGLGAGKRPGSADIADLSQSMLARLSRTIESEIIPRFMLAFDSHSAPQADATGVELGDKIDEFVDLVVKHDASVAIRYITTLRGQGAALAVLYLDLLAPAARKLGAMWESDEASFSDVAIGLCRMHQVLLEFSRCFDPTDNAAAAGRNALIVPAPGEEHTFGLFMVVEFMRRAGWHCWTGSPADVTDVRKLVRSQRFDAVMLSLSADRHMDRTEDTIRDVRRNSLNRQAVVLLGGRSINERPELVAQMGADDTAKDGRGAVQVLNKLCGVTRGASPGG